MRRARGITLTDLVVLVVLAAVFAVLVFPGCGSRSNAKTSALAQAHEAARRTQCMNNVRQIGLAMYQYAAEHDDQFPDLVNAEGEEVRAANDDGTNNTTDPARSAFAVLLNRAYLTTTKVFVCPSSGDTVATADDGFPTDYKAVTLNKLILRENQCSYGWDPTKRASANASCALIADKPATDVSAASEGTEKNNSDNHEKAGQNVWYNDGHVKWSTTSQPDAGDDPDFYLGGTGYEISNTDAKIIR